MKACITRTRVVLENSLTKNYFAQNGWLGWLNGSIGLQGLLIHAMELFTPNDIKNCLNSLLVLFIFLFIFLFSWGSLGGVLWRFFLLWYLFYEVEGFLKDLCMFGIY